MNDFLIDSTGDLIIQDGDLVIGESDDQQKEILLVSEKGSFKENPAVGVGLQDFLEADGADLLGEMRRQFIADGMVIDSASSGVVVNGSGQLVTQFFVNAHY